MVQLLPAVLQEQWTVQSAQLAVGLGRDPRFELGMLYLRFSSWGPAVSTELISKYFIFITSDLQSKFQTLDTGFFITELKKADFSDQYLMTEEKVKALQALTETLSILDFDIVSNPLHLQKYRVVKNEPRV